jgi:hypothetical protein
MTCATCRHSTERDGLLMCNKLCKVTRDNETCKYYERKNDDEG